MIIAKIIGGIIGIAILTTAVLIALVFTPEYDQEKYDYMEGDNGDE